MRNLLVIVLLVLVLITSGCTTTTQEVPTPVPTTIEATPTPEPTVTRPLAGVDPIIGAWDNGMVFNTDGTIGGDKNVTWKANDMLQYSYFVTVESRAVTDAESGKRIDPTALSTEWIYNPYSDAIHKRDSTTGVRRVVK